MPPVVRGRDFPQTDVALLADKLNMPRPTAPRPTARVSARSIEPRQLCLGDVFMEHRTARRKDDRCLPAVVVHKQ